MNKSVKSAGSLGVGAVLGMIFFFVACLFLLDLIVPDPVPVLDELVLLALTIASGGGSYRSIQTYKRLSQRDAENQLRDTKRRLKNE